MSKDCKSGACKDKLSSMIDLLAEKINQHGLTELKFENEDLSLKLSKQQTVVSAVATPVATGSTPTSASSAGHTEKSPMVGVVYFAPEPGANPYITVGSTVKKGDTICLIEAMKTFNPVKATKDGTVKDILVKSEDAVEYDTPLVVIG
ncbi:MAG: acetyl-CoA carboxylase biotin carboxyl carrier protein [Alphaproteobacteria bacterium]|nr:acetyl-CoA carboxylase biotin carboxyl carrier protein [Alphaproteobacteria bacterium]MBN2779636.1 acetyl-CoA carboxylase biotin carboxyl carrier protein [Alphaproteobacteria bacterium]